MLCPYHCISVGLENRAQTTKYFELLIKEQVLSIKEDSTAHCLAGGIHLNLSKCYIYPRKINKSPAFLTLLLVAFMCLYLADSHHRIITASK